jgi:hypothetical protein
LVSLPSSPPRRKGSPPPLHFQFGEEGEFYLSFRS